MPLSGDDDPRPKRIFFVSPPSSMRLPVSFPCARLNLWGYDYRSIYSKWWLGLSMKGRREMEWRMRRRRGRDVGLEVMGACCVGSGLWSHFDPLFCAHALSFPFCPSPLSSTSSPSFFVSLFFFCLPPQFPPHSCIALRCSALLARTPPTLHATAICHPCFEGSALASFL